MMTMRAQLAPALLLLLVLLAAAVPLVPALTPQEIRDRKINGANKLYIMGVDPDAYAAGEKKSTPEAPKDAVQKTSYVMGAGTEPKPESKRDEKVLEAKINAEVKAMRKEAAYDDAVAEKKAKELKSKPKNTTDDAEDHAKEKKSKSKGDSSEDDNVEKKSKSKLDYSADEKKEKKPKNKDDDAEEKKSKSKSHSSEDIDDEKKEKKSKSKEEDYAEKKLKSKDEDDEKKEKKSKSKEDSTDDDSEKKSKSKSEAYENQGAEKKSKEKSESSEDAGEKKKSKSKNKEEDFDAVPVESKADESVPAAEPTKKTPPADSYQAPTTTTMSAADTPDGYLPPKMSAADTPDGYAAPTTMSAADTPDGYVTPSKAQPAMSAADTPDGYVPATDSPDGNVPASDSPDGYAAPSTKPKVTVQSFSEMVPQSVLQMLSPKVKSLCAKTSFTYTCQRSIARLPETTVVPARQKDGLGVLTLAVDAVRAKLVEAKNAAKDLAVDPHTDKITKGAISDCLQMYDDIGTSYDTALLALKRGDRGAATSAVDSARTFVDTCDQGFLDRQGLKPVMADQEKVLAQLTSNVIAINKFMY